MKSIAYVRSQECSPASGRILKKLEESGIALYPLESVPVNSVTGILVIWDRDLPDELSEETLYKLEAAATNSYLVSVLTEKVLLSSEIESHPKIDLVGWRGSEENPHFLRLKDRLEEILEPRTGTKKLVGKANRTLRQRIFTTTALLSLTSFILIFIFNLLSLQNNLCSIRFGQPGASDFCGYFGLGGKPTKDERITWASITPGDCDALRSHVEKYPSGAFYQNASAMLNAKREKVTKAWVLTTQTLPLYVNPGYDATFAETLSLAKSLVKEQGEMDADRLCRGLTSTNELEFESSSSVPKQWNCETLRKGHTCSFDGDAVCTYRRLAIRKEYTCG